MKVLTISQVNFFLKSLIEGDGRLTDIYVAGEISNFTDHYRSGHLYFSLKDERAVMKAVMFASAARRLRFKPKDGMRVIVRCRVSMYEASGQVQIYVEEMQPDGLGALSLAFEQMKEKLAKEGLFREECKKPIPRFPRRVGLITSPTGAAVQDMKTILARRWPCAELVFCPVLVQGEGAPAQLIEAVRQMNTRHAADVILLGRGGGSAEELAAFNDEGLARAVFASEIPVISAVGHETDFSICDLVADLRAPTPSAAAELAVPDGAEVLRQLDALSARMGNAMKRRIGEQRIALDTLCAKRVLREPIQLTARRREALEHVQQRLCTAEKQLLSGAREALAGCSGRLDALSPLKVLARGYSILTDEGTGDLVKSASGTTENAVLHARLANGALRLAVLEAHSEERQA